MGSAAKRAEANRALGEAMLAAFNFRELELLICGLPDIDVNVL